MRTYLFLAIWILLFATTLVVRTIFAGNAVAAPRSPKAHRSHEVLVELASMPRASNIPLTEPTPNFAFNDPFHQLTDNPIYSVIDNALRDRAADIRECVSGAMALSERSNEYVEFSFVARRYLEQNPPVTLSEITTERSTIALSMQEQLCLQDVFASLNVATENLRLERTFYTLCLSKKKSG